MKKEITIKRYKWGHIIEEKEYVADERIIDIFIDTSKKISVSISPEELTAFAYGFLITSGYITLKDDVKEINIRRDSIEIQLSHLPGHDEIKKEPFDSIMEPEFGKLPALFKAFSRYSTIFDDTGGVHSAAAISDGVSILFFSEDVGRLNAVDKVVGKAFLQDTGMDSGNYFLLTNGRLSSEVVTKAFMAGLRAVVSLSAPTAEALAVAKKCRIGIIGFLRGKTFNIYS